MEHNNWMSSGRPAPPPHIVKQKIVKEFAGKHGPRIFIETGTFMGEMVDACATSFSRIYSIELSEKLFLGAAGRFSNQQHISIIQGDSYKILPEILKKIEEPCLFWLDGHYSGGFTAKGKQETPILQELAAILDHPIDRHVILIDDARCFIGQNDYPTIEELRDVILSRRPDWAFEVDTDIIRAVKRNAL